MEPTIRYSPEAEEDVYEARRWYEKKRNGLGWDFVMCVDEVLERIRRSPESFPVVYNNVRQAVVRRFPYSIIFRVEADEIVIYAVHHGSRDPEVWRSRI